MHALQIHQPEPRNLHRALTIRDFQILKFLWEMKFADGLTLHYGFFQTHKDNSQRTSTKYAINRLTKLKALGCVDREAVLGYPTKLFRLTKFGASLLQSNCPEIEVNYDRQPIDFHTLLHDLKVSRVRVALEHLKRASNWQSERVLKQKSTIVYGLSKQYMPDGVYNSRDGELVAFELEIARKSLARYKDKIQKMVA